MAELREATRRLHDARDAQKRRVAENWECLQDPSFRRDLLGEGIRKTLLGIPFIHALRETLNPDRAAWSQVLGMAFASSRKTKTSRIVGAIAALVIPELVERLATPERIERLYREIHRSFDRIRERWRERRAAAEPE
ncbi:MAG: hypothetical protein IPL52_00455 [Flavobacteriales bacterium]|nr:hypothetical protein [Flavobacteriales bacterium]